MTVISDQGAHCGFRYGFTLILIFYLLTIDDGDMDVVVCNNVGPPEIQENLGGNQFNLWIKVKVMHRYVQLFVSCYFQLSPVYIGCID